MTRSAILAVLFAALVLSGCDREGDEPAQESESKAPVVKIGEIDDIFAGELMPAANLTNPQGEALNLAALQGRPVLVNLWATWCAPCVKEMPLLSDLAADYEGRLQVVTISQDMDDPADVALFFDANNLENLPQWIDPQLALGDAMGAATLPTTVLYDASGQEVWRVTGDFDWASEEARAAIDEALQPD